MKVSLRLKKYSVVTTIVALFGVFAVQTQSYGKEERGPEQIEGDREIGTLRQEDTITEGMPIPNLSCVLKNSDDGSGVPASSNGFVALDTPAQDKNKYRRCKRDRAIVTAPVSLTQIEDISPRPSLSDDDEINFCTKQNVGTLSRSGIEEIQAGVVSIEPSQTGKESIPSGGLLQQRKRTETEIKVPSQHVYCDDDLKPPEQPACLDSYVAWLRSMFADDYLFDEIFFLPD
jgi:hypothetical protein